MDYKTQRNIVYAGLAIFAGLAIYESAAKMGFVKPIREYVQQIRERLSPSRAIDRFFDDILKK